MIAIKWEGHSTLAEGVITCMHCRTEIQRGDEGEVVWWQGAEDRPVVLHIACYKPWREGKIGGFNRIPLDLFVYSLLQRLQVDLTDVEQRYRQRGQGASFQNQVR